MSKSLKDIKASLELLIKCQIPVFLWGPTGLGKSSLINQIALEQGRKVIDIRLSQIEFSDLRGIPYIKSENVVWSKPSFLPTESNDNSIIFLDEMNCAHQMILSAAYQLVLDRKIGEYTLPKNTIVIAAGNREQDNEEITEIPKPLLNRFAHLEVDYDFKAWEEYAKDKYNSIVVEYLKSKKSDLYTKPEEIKGKAFATPRSWEKVSNILDTYSNYQEMDKDIKNLKEAIVACVGTAGLGLVSFIKSQSGERIDFKKIFLKGSEYMIDNSIDGNMLQYIKDGIWEELIYRHKIETLTDLANADLNTIKKISKEIDNSIAFVLHNSDKEFAKSMINFYIQEKKLKLYPAYMPIYQTVIY